MPARSKKGAIDLSLKSTFENSFFGVFLKWSLSYGRYIIIATEIVVLAAFFLRFKYDRELTDLHESVNQKVAILETAQDFEKDIRLAQTKIEQIQDLENKQIPYLKEINFLGRVTPLGLSLINLSLNKEKLTFDGTSDSDLTFALFLNNLYSSNKFKSIKLSSVQHSLDTNKIQFRIDALLDLTKLQ